MESPIKRQKNAHHSLLELAKDATIPARSSFPLSMIDKILPFFSFMIIDHVIIYITGKSFIISNDIGVNDLILNNNFP